MRETSDAGARKMIRGGFVLMGFGCLLTLLPILITFIVIVIVVIVAAVGGDPGTP